jgi:hypothetical protein
MLSLPKLKPLHLPQSRSLHFYVNLKRGPTITSSFYFTFFRNG